MSDNRVFVLVSALFVLLQAGALGWSLLGRRLVPVLIANAATAATVSAYLLVRLPYLLRPPADWAGLVLLAGEAAVALLTLPAHAGNRLAASLSCLAWGVHLCASATALAFALTFRLERLI